MYFTNFLCLSVQATLSWAFPYQAPLRTSSGPTPSQLQHAVIRSEVAQGVSLFSLLIDQHRFDEMDKVFTSPLAYIDLPEDGFRNLTRLNTFVSNLYTDADYPFQHSIGVPVVEIEDSMTVAHVASPLIATVFDGYDGEKATPNEAEYGLYVSLHTNPTLHNQYHLW